MREATPWQLHPFGGKVLEGGFENKILINKLMKQIKLANIRVYELSTVIDNIAPKDLANLKDIRLASSIVKDLRDSCKEYSDKASDLSVKQQAVFKSYQEEASDKVKEMNKEEQDKFLQELNGKFQNEINEKFKTEAEELNELANKECTVELSDEKHDKLVSFFEKYATAFYLKKDVLLLVAEALGI